MYSAVGHLSMSLLIETGLFSIRSYLDYDKIWSVDPLYKRKGIHVLKNDIVSRFWYAYVNLNQHILSYEHI